MFPSLQHFGGRGACWNFRMGTRKIDKQLNYSHGPAQTKQQVGQCIVKALLVHKRTTSEHKLIRLNTAQTWGKPPPSPLQYTLCMTTGPTLKCRFCPRTSILGTPTTLEAHNFVCGPPIKVVALIKSFSMVCGMPPTRKEIEAIPDFQWLGVKLTI